jgi:uncharacterized protein YuzB (UPF0349 family)
MIKLCKFNSFHVEVSDFLENNNIEYSIEECLGRCDLCHSGAFIQIDEDYISAENGEKLIIEIKNRI